MREKAFTVTIHDCEVQTFMAGGPGGQNQNKRETGVRVIHHPSGARGESREQRSQLQNKKAAFRRMAESEQFRRWCGIENAKVIAKVDRLMWPRNIKVEVKVNGEWVEQ
jgi:hypothetical protein